MLKRISLLFIVLLCIPFTCLPQQETVELSLNDVVVMALKNNYDIQVSNITIDLYKQDDVIAQSIWDTNLTGSISYEKDEGESLLSLSSSGDIDKKYSIGATKLFPTGTEFSMTHSATLNKGNSSVLYGSKSTNSSLTFELNQPLLKNFNGLVDRKQVQIQKINTSKFSLGQKSAIEKKIYDVVLAYWNLYITQKQNEINQKSVELAKEFLDLNEKQAQTGFVEETDVIAAKANLVAKETNLIENNAQLFKAKLSLAVLLNDYYDNNIVLTSKPSDINLTLNSRDEIEKAFLNRRDIKQEKMELEKQGIQLLINDNKTLPDLTLTGSVTPQNIRNTYSDSIGDTSSFRNDDYFIGLTLNFPLENSNAKANNVKAALNKQIAFINIQKIEAKVKNDIKIKLNEISKKYEILQNAYKLKNLQEEKLEKENERYSAGRSSSRNVIDYQNDLINAENILAQAEVNYEKSITALKYSQNVLLNLFEKE